MAVYLTEVVTDLAMPPQQRPIPHQFAMGDNNAYTITALLCDSRNPEAELMDGTVGGELVRPDGVTVALEGEKGADVRQVNLAAGGLCNATPCSVTLPQACFAVPGRVTLTIKLTDGTTITQALSVSAVVVRTSTDEAVDPGEVIPDLAAIQAAAAEATAAAADARAAASSAVRYDAAQSLTDAQKTMARKNIGAADEEEFDAVAYPLDVEMLTTADEAVRVLSGGISGSGGDLSSATRARTQYFRVQPGHRYLFELNNAEFVVISAWEYGGTSQSTVIGRVDEAGYTKSRFAFTASGNFARIAFGHTDTSVTMTEEDRALILAAISLKESPVDGNFAPVDTTTATATHAAGSLLTVNGQLYEATQAIATGDTIAAGTNVSPTTVAAQLAERDTAIAGRAKSGAIAGSLSNDPSVGDLEMDSTGNLYVVSAVDTPNVGDVSLTPTTVAEQLAALAARIAALEANT